MAYILLVRHGQNDWVKKQRLAGWLPGVHLNDVGQKQAAEAAERLAHLPVKAVFSSPVTRCMETAVVIAGRHSLPIEELLEVGEVRYGLWEGKKIKTLAKEKGWYAVQHYPSRFRFPEGESFTEVQTRAVAALEALNSRFEPHDLVIVCSHADVIKLVLAHYLGMHMDLFQRIGVNTASVSTLALMPGGRVSVERINDSGPIPVPKPPEEKKKTGRKAKKKRH